MIFGLFSILGYRFSPRISDMGDARFWRATWPGEGRFFFTIGVGEDRYRNWR
jgi:TnpA family transposase